MERAPTPAPPCAQRLRSFTVPISGRWETARAGTGQDRRAAARAYVALLEPMAIREFTDSAGVRWQVWATTPSRGNVRPQFASGWLAFECGSERRRLAPFPPEWTEVDVDALCALLAQATVAVRGSSTRLLPPLAADPVPAEPVPAGPAPADAGLAAPEQTGVAAADPPPDDSPPAAAAGPPGLESTVARVRAVLREVEASWEKPPSG